MNSVVFARVRLSVSLVLLGFFSALTWGAPAAPDIAGNWKGRLDLGQIKLRLVFKISKVQGSGWAATFDSLDQGARDLPIDSVTLSTNVVRMKADMLKGAFVGTVDKTGQKIAGTWRQGEQSLPLVLEKFTGPVTILEPEVLSPDDLAASKLAAQKLAGTWTGSLFAGSTTLRLRVQISATAQGAAAGTMDIADQGTRDIPLSAITLKGEQARFEAKGLTVSYEGTLNKEGTLLKGRWMQGSQGLPLELKKAPATEGRSEK